MFQLIIIIISIICIFGYSAITTESIDIYGSLKYGTLDQISSKSPFEFMTHVLADNFFILSNATFLS
jgi:hypothetical protein